MQIRLKDYLPTCRAHTLTTHTYTTRASDHLPKTSPPVPSHAHKHKTHIHNTGVRPFAHNLTASQIWACRHEVSYPPPTFPSLSPDEEPLTISLLPPPTPDPARPLSLPGMEQAGRLPNSEPVDKDAYLLRRASVYGCVCVCVCVCHAGIDVCYAWQRDRRCGRGMGGMGANLSNLSTHELTCVTPCSLPVEG